MRSSFRRRLGTLAGALVSLALACVPAVEDRLVDAGIARLADLEPAPLFDDDALRVVLCGTASPLPDPERAQACTAVFAAGRFWVVDTGLGSWRNLARWRVDGSRIGGILLSHFHSDHIGELGEFNLQTWVAGRPGPLQVYGPIGVHRVVAGFQEAYALDTRYRTAHHGSELLPPGTAVLQPRAVRAREAEVVLEQDGLRITAIPVDHRPASPALAYRFDYRGRSVLVSGDTKRDARLVQAARGIDVLVHEAQSNALVAKLREAIEAERPRVGTILGDIPSYHTTPLEAAEIANEAGVRLLVLSHLTPPPRNRLLARVFTRGIEDVRPDGWELGVDGLMVELPVDSEALEISRLD